MLIRCNRIKKHFPAKNVLADVSLSIQSGEKVFLLGRNGSGKSTLLKVINEELEVDGGSLERKGGLRTIFLRQFSLDDEERTVRACIDEAFAHNEQREKRLKELEGRLDEHDAADEYTTLLAQHNRERNKFSERLVLEKMASLGLEAHLLHRKVCELSGGQKQKVFLLRTALSSCDLMMMDEPTNQLDIPAISWLENFIRDFKGACLIISHDERFVRSLSDRIFYLAGGSLETFKGGYQDFLDFSEKRNTLVLRRIREQKELIREANDLIGKFGVGTRSSQARAKKKQLERLDLIDAPLKEKDIASMPIRKLDYLPNDILAMIKADFDYGREGFSLKDVNFTIHRDEKTALVGLNGSGKSTLIKLIMGQLPLKAGKLKTGNNVIPEYFDQEYGSLDGELNSFETVRKEFRDLSDEEIRSRLGSYLIQGDDVFIPVKKLSGGECCRLQLLMLFLKEPTFIILDEPTNNLDMSAISVLTCSIQKFNGPVLLVSHDRELLSNVCNKFIVVTEAGVRVLSGSYASCEKDILKLLGQDFIAVSAAAEIKKTPRKDPREKVRRPNKYKIDQAEKKIFELEERKQEIEKSFDDPDLSSDYLKVQELNAELEQIEGELEKVYLEWEELNLSR